MAYQLYANDFPLSSSEAVFLLKERLKTGGWMISGSSDGSTYNSAGDQITLSGSGAGGLSNTNAWFRVRSPDFLREFLIQRSTSNDLWEVWYSSDGVGFVSGSPSATVLPTAGDGKQICGVNGGAEDWFPQNDTYKTDLLVGDVDEGYSFYFGVRQAPQARVNAGLFLDVLTNTSSFDADPAVVGMMLDDEINGGTFFQAALGGCFNGNTTSSGSIARCYGWFKKGQADERFTVIPMATLGVDSTSDEDGLDQLGTQPEDGSFATFDCLYIRDNESSGDTEAFYKGISRLFRLNSTLAGHGIPYSDNTRIFFGSVSIPWLTGTVFIK